MDLPRSTRITRHMQLGVERVDVRALLSGYDRRADAYDKSVLVGGRVKVGLVGELQALSNSNNF